MKAFASATRTTDRAPFKARVIVAFPVFTGSRDTSMQAWEAHNKVPMESMAFLLGTVALQPEEIAAAAADILCIFLCTGVIGQDTLRSLGCGDGDGVVVGWVAVRCIAGGGGTYVGVLGLQGGVKVPSNKQHVTHWCGTYEFLKLVPYMTSQLLVLLGTYVWSLHVAGKMLSLNMQQPSRHNLLDTWDRKGSI